MNENSERPIEEEPDAIATQRRESPITDGHDTGCRHRVRECLGVVGLPIGRVCVVGCHVGWEMDEFIKAGAESVVGVDVVPDFVEACVAKGLDAKLVPAEALSLGLVKDPFVDEDTRHNFYASHVLEHCEDPGLAVKLMMNNLDRWIYVEVPIQPGVNHNPAHLSPFQVHRECLTLFRDLRIVKMHDTGIRLSFAAFKE